MTRILHTADIHLDSPLRSLALRDTDLRDTVEAATRTALSRIVDLALNERVAALLIAGDLFDGQERSARSAAFLLGEMERLRAGDVRVFLIKGNHDAENPVTGALDLPGNVHVFDARGGKVRLTDEIWIHGVSFADRHAPESLLPRFGPPVDGAINIAMLHSSLAGAAGHDVYAPCSVSELRGMGFDYWALGHVHARHVHATEPWVVMPGMPQGRDIGESGPKTASLLDIRDGAIAVSTVPTSVVEFTASTLDVTDAADDDTLRAALRAHVTAQADAIEAPSGVIRLTLTGAPARRWQILRDRDVWTDQVARMARATGRLWLDKLKLELSESRSDDRPAGATDELAALMAAIRAEPGFAAAARSTLEQVLDDLPPGLRARLAPDEDATDRLADALARDGAARVLARMKGAEG